MWKKFRTRGSRLQTALKIGGKNRHNGTWVVHSIQRPKNPERWGEGGGGIAQQNFALGVSPGKFRPTKSAPGTTAQPCRTRPPAWVWVRLQVCAGRREGGRLFLCQHSAPMGPNPRKNAHAVGAGQGVWRDPKTTETEGDRALGSIHRDQILDHCEQSRTGERGVEALPQGQEEPRKQATKVPQLPFAFVRCRKTPPHTIPEPQHKDGSL